MPTRSTAWLRCLAVAACACQPARTPRPEPPPPEEQALLAARDRGDVVAMRAHGWALWAWLGDRWPSWPSSDVVIGQPDRVLRPLRPFRNGDTIEAEALPVMFSVVFDPTAAAHIRRYQLGSRTALRRYAAVPEFPRAAIALKLVWYPVHRDRRTALPIWDGVAANPDARGNPDRTWPRSIAIDPSLALGDHLVLLGMHATTKEIPDWVWATYWWHDRPDDGRFAAGRPTTLTGAARHYLMDVAYSAETPVEADGTPPACMNPWLEARFPGGLHSNCLTCHQRAALGAADFLPVTRQALADDDPYFAGKTTTDFLWTLALEAH